MLFVNQTELIILLVVCAIAAACFVTTMALGVWVLVTHRRRQKPVRELIGLSADAAAAKQTFVPGEEFTYDGLVVNAVYNLEPTAETLTQFDALTEEEYAHLTAAGSANGLYVIKPNMAKAGRSIVIIRYKDKATYYAITISEPVQEAQPPVEPAEEAPVEAPAEVVAEAPVEEPVEEVPAEEVPAEPVAEAPVEETPVEQAPAEEAPVEEVPAEKVPVEEPVAVAVAEAPAEEGSEEELEETFAAGGIRYNRSFTAKLIQSDDETKSWYSALKNELLSYHKVKARMSWKRESFRAGRNTVARFAFRGNTLCIYLPLDPAAYAETKYKVEDVGDSASYADTPCMYRLKNARRARYAEELIAASMEAQGIARIEHEAEDYSLPYEETEALIEKGLIKCENGGEVGAAPVSQAPAEEPVQAPAEVVAEEPAEEVPAEEPVEEAPAEVVAEEPAEVPAEEGSEEELEETFAVGGVRYNRSFTAKLIQSDDTVKAWYSTLKNELLSYKRVKARMSWKRESFHFGRKNVVRFSFRGKALCVYFALDPAEYEGSQYKIEAVEGPSSFSDTPCLYRMKNDKRVRYAKELIETVMESVGAVRNEAYSPEDAYLPYEETEALVERGLIKVVNGQSGGIPSQDTNEEAPQDVVEEIAAAEEVPEEPAEEPVVEEAAEEVPEEAPEEPVVEEPTEEIPEEPAEPAEEVPEEEPAEEPEIAEVEVEELSTQELDDVQSYEERERDEDGIEVVGVMFRRRGRKVYWFDPDGKHWEKGEIALYISSNDPPQEVIVVDNAKLSPSKLHLPLKPLHKVSRPLHADKA